MSMGSFDAGAQGRLARPLWAGLQGLPRCCRRLRSFAGPKEKTIVIPPPDLLFRSTGCKRAEWYVESGERSCREFAEVLSAVNRSFAEFRSILDFGCGCGRILRALREHLAGGHLSATDQDRAAVGWLRQHYPDIDVRCNFPLPPLPFAEASFDLVIAYSVFTHLDEAYQDAWLGELHRVTRPGTVLLLTVHGPTNWEWAICNNQTLREAVERPVLEAELRDRGFTYWRAEGWAPYFPDFYHTSWHQPAYVRQHWARWFRVLDIWPAKALGNHDIVVLQRD
jgi:SAM-dependent methyltransferase